MVEGKPLTSRQQTLFKRLDYVCKRAETLELPVKIEEIWAFGSSIRGKDAPGDIDLVAKFSRFHPAFELFKDISQNMITKNGWSDSRPTTPSLALAGYMSSAEKRQEYQKVYTQWLEPITWAMIDRHMFPDMYGHDWTELTRRILLHKIRGVHIMEIIGLKDRGMTAAKAYQLVWSVDKPNVYSNLQLALSVDGIRSTCVTEHRNFDSQLDPLLVRIRMLRNLLPKLLEHKGPLGSYDECDDWLQKRAAEIFPEYSENILHRY